jgi:hypothetical protein
VGTQALADRTRNLDMIAGMRRAAAERESIEYARRVVERWNAAVADGRDVWWSPTIRAAIVAGMGECVLPRLPDLPKPRPADNRSTPAGLGR